MRAKPYKSLARGYTGGPHRPPAHVRRRERAKRILGAAVDALIGRVSAADLVQLLEGQAARVSAHAHHERQVKR